MPLTCWTTTSPYILISLLGLHDSRFNMTKYLFSAVLYRNKFFIARFYAGGWSYGSGGIYDTNVTVRSAMSRT